MYETILVPTDGSEGSVAAAAHAVNLAATHGATVHALYVVDVRMSPVDSDMDHDEAVALVEESDVDPTAAVLDRAERAGVPAVEAVRLGVPDECIRAYAEEVDADLVVMGTHGRTGVEHAILGSVTERVVRTLDVPVLTVHPSAADE
ncbi:Nucleotide-binding universal stress protein, UspA family [Haloplanus vescus]|uniref:Nucleotide-binding universal stress protein, UspA family n=1 Tax=Haloplanus vescus TaxID=555874 RepID=A0A1H3VR23_9EURY|nr:universal stress protein [Haloplanus vescus]SDZ77255.1 Nucleotide-binding universal stress protein, UspA family [Haloplanus vescus]